MNTNTVELSNLYSIRRNPETSVQVYSNEIEQFIGSLFFIPIYGLPRSGMFWRTEVQVVQVADITSRNWLKTIKSNLHFTDKNSMAQCAYKLFKLRPFLDSLVQNLHQSPIEEQIIPFKGKQYFESVYAE